MNSNIIYNKKPVSFGTITREVSDYKGKVLYRNDTRMFREDLNWNFLMNYLKNKKVPQKIYCYACSDGSEPYSIVMALKKYFGDKKAQDFFPIIAKDKDYKMIQKVQEQNINLDLIDIRRIEDYQKPMPFYKKDPYEKHETYWNGQEKPLQYIVDKKLANCVDFKVGNILEDAENINYENSIIFFRNVWPYLSKNENEKLLNIFEKKFTPSTSLVVGSFDEIATYKDGISFKDMLLSKNFFQTRPKIYEKWCPDLQKTTINTAIKAIGDDFINLALTKYEDFRSIFMNFEN